MTFADTPIDTESAARLAEHGLRLDLVDTGDPEAFTAWLQADSRGFHGERIADKQRDELLRLAADRRTTGVWDATAADPATPVATVSSWPMPMTVPGGGSIPAWAISSVTVAPTHRRHGIARALLEAELRTANSLGIPVANLTVSEATIYSRYGFAPSAMAADLTIDTRRARWSGPSASGRLHFVSLEQVRDECRGIYGLARLQHPGDVALDGALWEQLIGTIGDSKDEAKNLRAVRYDDASGEPQGFAIYRVTGGETDFTTHTVSIRYLCAVTDDAYAGLWRYLLELDLVTTVDAPLRAVDEPVLWQLTDVRAVRATRSDHLWVRILDVKAALEARTYSAPGRIVLEIADPLGFANGRVLVTVDAHGAATVTPATVSPATGDVSDADAALSLTIVDLGALYLGGTSAHTLVRAGRVTELRPGSADAFDASFRSASAPWLSTWF